MGGSGIPITETKNYVWMLWSNWGGDHPYYWLELRRKSDDIEIDIPKSGYSSESERSEECDAAYEELKKERSERWHYEEMTKEQLVLADIYARMKTAEQSLECCIRRRDDAEECVSKMRKAGGLIPEKKV